MCYYVVKSNAIYKYSDFGILIVLMDSIAKS